MCKVCDDQRQHVIDFNVDDFIQSKLNEFPNMAGHLGEYRNTLLNLQSQATSSSVSSKDIHRNFEQTLKDVEVVITAEEHGLTAEATAGLETEEEDPLAPSKLPDDITLVNWDAVRPITYTPSQPQKMDEDEVAKLFEQKETED